MDLPRHNAHYCAEHRQQLGRRQMAKAVDDFDMLSMEDRILVAVTPTQTLSMYPGFTNSHYRSRALPCSPPQTVTAIAT